MTNKGTSGGKRQKGFSWHESFDEKNKNSKKGKFGSSQFPSLLPFFGKLFCGEKNCSFFCKSLSVSRVNVVVVAAAAIVVAGVVVVVVRVAEKIAKGRPEKSFNVLTK